MTIRLGAFLTFLAVWLANPAFAEDSVFYVLGEVREPGQFPLPEEQGITFSQAIEMAGGIRHSGKATECVLHRRSAGASITVQKINLAAIAQGT
jgi:protein involved in polysaccharide export with SLBB domain